MQSKVCTKCGAELLATPDYFHRHKQHRDGLCTQCKQCRKYTGKVYRRKHADQLRRTDREYYNTTVGHLRHVYSNMNQRCNDPKSSGYKYYGERGIKLLFTPDQFVDYVVNTLKVDPHGLTIDRIDNDGHYEPGNIRFVTHKKNCQNRKRKEESCKAT